MLVPGSRKPEAKQFKRWFTHEIIPAIRQTGTYTINPISSAKEDTQLARAKVMEMNARTRAMQTWLKIVKPVSIPEYKQMASTYAANTLTDKEVLALPKTEAKTYAATEIRKLANENNLKIPEYGIEV